MKPLRFEWDPGKNLGNKRRHGISFEEAQAVFLDENALMIHDPDHSDDEDRFVLLGLSAKIRTPGVGRADVWVFDAGALGNTLGGAPLTNVTLFTDTPRALAATPDGTRVYAAGFHTGNQTTVIGQAVLPDGFGPDGAPGPATNFEGIPAPEIGAILKWSGAHWVDALGRTRDQYVKFSLPDKDVFAIDASSLNETAFTASVGTTNFNLAVNPVSGKLYVSNTEANNLTRFESPGCGGVAPVTGFEVGNISKTVGKLALSRISVVPNPDATDAMGATVQARHLPRARPPRARRRIRP